QPAVRVFLAAALSPRVQAATRWIGVNAVSRRAFALSGKDSGSPLLHWLCRGQRSGGPTNGPSDEAFVAAADRIGAHDQLDARGFLGWYRALNDDYPFLDYSSDDARTADSRLMAAYAAQGDPPPPT